MRLGVQSGWKRGLDHAGVDVDTAASRPVICVSSSRARSLTKSLDHAGVDVDVATSRWQQDLAMGKIVSSILAMGYQLAFAKDLAWPSMSAR